MSVNCSAEKRDLYAPAVFTAVTKYYVQNIFFKIILSATFLVFLKAQVKEDLVFMKWVPVTSFIMNDLGHSIFRNLRILGKSQN